MKLLSICIPTYNRAKFLQENLKYLLPQVQENDDAVELIISNNASTDETVQIIEQYKSQGYNFKYLVNETNLGPDKNFYSCVMHAQGKYIWLLGDDDYIIPGGIFALLNLLQNSDYGAIYVQSGNRADKNPFSIGQEEKLNHYVYNDSNVYLQRVSYYITFMSGNIFNRCVLDSDIDFTKYFYSQFFQVPLYVNSALMHTQNVYINTPLIYSAGNQNGGYTVFKVFGQNLFNILEKFISKGLNLKTINYIKHDISRNFFPYYIMLGRSCNNTFVAEKPQEVLQDKFGDLPEYKWLLVPMATWPLPLAKIYWFGFRVVRKLCRIVGVKL
ncbi:MAG: glycosyltransferase family 2 protein [Phascolarctobacterium sp.]|nr:glycosyltransferase family 2 protein [Phascolarctobacterium sp.]